MGRWLMDDELERICKGAINALMGILTRNLSGETEKNEDKFNECSWFPGRDSNIVSPE
jgi:hypothetical protein